MNNFTKFNLLLGVGMLLMNVKCICQFNTNLPDILPPSPEVANLTKAGIGAVDQSTGAINASIPLYTLKVKEITFPISLSYNSQGIKTDEACSRVGCGWNINSGGVITRVVRGQPDEMTPWLDPPGPLNLSNAQNYNYVNLIASNNFYDTEVDEFIYSFNGYSGRFVVGKFGQVIQLTNSNLRIEIDNNYYNIKITDPNGIKYYFGGAQYEETISHNVLSLSGTSPHIKTGYFLNKILAPSGASLDFVYSNINTEITNGMWQTVTFPDSVNSGPSPVNPCLDCPDNTTTLKGVYKTIYNTKYLTSIVGSNGLSVTFSYESRPDQTGDNRLIRAVFNQGLNSLKSYRFEYYNVPGQDGTSHDFLGHQVLVGRFFLTKLVDEERSYDEYGEYTFIDREYIFDYYDRDEVVMPISTQQDQFGFANNNSNQSLLPPFNNYTFGSFAVADRSSNADIAKKGMLKSIIYPTGGKEEFIYEANTINESVLRNTKVSKSMSIKYDEGSANVKSILFEIKKPQDVTFHYQSSWDSLDTTSIPPSLKWFRMRVYWGDSTVVDRTLLGLKTDSLVAWLEPYHSYRFEIAILNNREESSGSATMIYDTSATNIYDRVNTEVSGLRVRQIKMTDLFTGTTSSKFYTYAGLEDLTKSTAIANKEVFYLSRTKNLKTCIADSNSFVLYRLCELNLYSTNTTFSGYNFNGSHISYKKIIESDDENFKNGGTEYEFFDPVQAYSDQVFWGGELPNVPSTCYGTLTGKVYKTKVFDSSFFVLKERTDNYAPLWMSGDSGYVTSYLIRKKYDMIEYPTPDYDEEMESFNVIQYRHTGRWLKLASTIEKEYDHAGNTFTNETLYTYNSEKNILPSGIVTTDSRGREVRNSVTYPTDYASGSLYKKMVQVNLIEKPIEENIYIDNILQQQKVTEYEPVLSDSSLILPSVVKLKASPNDALRSKIEFQLYDETGNPLQFNKTSNESYAYIWNYNKEYVVAQAIGAKFAQVAYSSFETGDQGNWMISSGTTINGGFTGYQSFSGTVTKDITDPGTYTVSLWTKQSATVNGQPGTQLKNKGGWKLFRYTLNNPSTVTVSGTGIDELRLIPLDAVMVTNVVIPGVGITAQGDANHNYKFYEYDPANRLRLVKDIDGNILQKADYKYLNIPYSNSDPVWIGTGETRCQECNRFKGFYTGKREELHRDANVRSSTYNQTKWIVVADDATCGQGCPTYSNPETLYARFYKSNCEGGGTASFTYIIPAGTVYSYISAQDAAAKALQKLNTEGQAIIDSVPCPASCGNMVVDNFSSKCINNLYEAGQIIMKSTRYDQSIDKYICTYYYQFSDGSTSFDWYAIGDDMCIIEL